MIHTDICSNCHPFYTGEQRIVDTEGQVDRFYKKLQAREQHVQDIEAREAARLTLDRTVDELELTKRATATLKKAELNNVGDIMEKMALGESALLEIDGFGRKSLADLKKRLRQIGYELPEVMEEIVV